MKRKYSREALEKVVPECKSVAEVLKRLGTRILNGGSHALVSKRIREYGINTDHFEDQKWTKGNSVSSRRKKAQFILVLREGGDRRQPSALLTRALVEAGREYKCYVCGIEAWNGKGIVLEIEHKDANPLNDLRENLEFICPNCHSQTDTYCRGKRGAEKARQIKELASKREDASGPNSDNYWRKKPKLKLRKVERPSREDLAESLRSSSMVAIGLKYGVSDNAVRKWCKWYGIAIPTRRR